uniref:hypothetical protein n=1 Tax=Salmonella enterica TaxID=28901 RepID=UPI00352359D8
EEYLAYTFIINSDNNKYGSLIKSLAQQQSLKNTQYPKTLTAASEVLMEHQWDEKYYVLSGSPFYSYQCVAEDVIYKYI